jgi:hypothetical protein
MAARSRPGSKSTATLFLPELFQKVVVEMLRDRLRQRLTVLGAASLVDGIRPRHDPILTHEGDGRARGIRNPGAVGEQTAGDLPGPAFLAMASTTGLAQGATPTLYISPTDDSFEVYLTAAMHKKDVPVQVTTNAEGAEYTLKTAELQIS